MITRSSGFGFVTTAEGLIAMCSRNAGSPDTGDCAECANALKELEHDWTFGVRPDPVREFSSPFRVL